MPQPLEVFNQRTLQLVVSNNYINYINDIADGLTSTVRMFADDTMAYLTVKSTQDAEEFQRDLDKLVDWEKTWQMEFHPDKCEIISITPRKRNPVKYIRIRCTAIC